jgi:hypothetical protein
VTLAVQGFPTAFTAGDQLPTIQGQLANTNLTGWSVSLYVERPAPNAALVIAGIISDAANGLFYFPWAPTDLVEGNLQRCEIRFTAPDGKTQTASAFTIDVQGANT